MYIERPFHLPSLHLKPRHVADLLFVATLAVLFPRSAPAQATPPAPEPKPGYPINNELVVRQCGACHTRDSTGRMGRLSYLRKSPEGWQTSVRRMASLNGVQIDPAQAREIVRYLANQQGLAPEEANPGRFEVERRMIDYTYSGDKDTEETCKACHSLGRVILQRRTKEEWELLVATHRAYYPIVDFQGFRRFGPPPDTGDARHPMEKAIAHLATAFPLETPVWRAWSATMRPPRLEGTWVLVGQEPGAGPVNGRVVISAVAGAPDEFTTDISFTYARTGQKVTRRGRAIVYTGFQWRGRSSDGNEQSALREVMTVERDWQSMSGRWFKGAYDELGLDVTLHRWGRDVLVSGVEPSALRTGGGEQEFKVYGANFASGLTAGTVDLGPGVHVTGVRTLSPEIISVKATVDSGAVSGRRDVFVAGGALKDGLVVYDKVDRIRITPQAGMARVGGAHFPKQLQQFEAVGWKDGPDGKPNTADDLSLGSIPVTWGLEEYAVTYDDDDIKFVGSIDSKGLFTPALDGPNPNRSGNRNNVGDVWVVATFTPATGAPIRGRSHLLVTVPLYMRWDPSGELPRMSP